jgi:hypothetical protein
VDRISLQCRAGHASIEVMGFVRRTEAEALAKLAEDPEPATEARILRAKARANLWVRDNAAERRGAHVRSPRRLAEGEDGRRSTVEDEKVFPVCPKCRVPLPTNGVSLAKLRPELDQIWAAGVATPTLPMIAAVLRTSSTQRRP